MAPPLKCPATAFAMEGFSATQRILVIAGALVGVAYFAGEVARHRRRLEEYRHWSGLGGDVNSS